MTPPTVDQVLRIARAGAWAALCPLCGKALKCANTRRVAGVRVRVWRCPTHGSLEVGTIEVVVSKEAQVALLREVERERRRVKRLKRQSDREAAHVA